MCNSLQRVDDGTAEIVDGVHFPRVASPVMGLRIATVDDGIAHSLVGVVHADFGSNAPSDALLRALFHLLKVGKINLNGSVSPLTWQSIPSLVLHGLLLGVVRVRFALFEHGDGVLIELVEVVTCVSRLVRTNSHQGQVFDNRILELLFLFGRVCIVKTADQCSLIHLMCEIVIQQCSFCVADMEVPTSQVQYESSMIREMREGRAYDGSGGKRVTTPFSVSGKAMS